MNRTISKSGLSLTFGIASIVFPMIIYQFIYLILGDSLIYFIFLTFFCSILAIVGLYLSRISLREIDNQIENVELIVSAKTGKICSIIGLCLNLYSLIQIVFPFIIWGIVGD